MDTDTVYNFFEVGKIYNAAGMQNGFSPAIDDPGRVPVVIKARISLGILDRICRPYLEVPPP
jgi:hypothetical protein